MSLQTPFKQIAKPLCYLDIAYRLEASLSQNDVMQKENTKLKYSAGK